MPLLQVVPWDTVSPVRDGCGPTATPLQAGALGHQIRSRSSAGTGKATGMRTCQGISVPPWPHNHHKDLLLKKLAWPGAGTSLGHPGQRTSQGSSDTQDGPCQACPRLSLLWPRADWETNGTIPIPISRAPEPSRRWLEDQPGGPGFAPGGDPGSGTRSCCPARRGLPCPGLS